MVGMPSDAKRTSSHACTASSSVTNTGAPSLITRCALRSLCTSRSIIDDSTTRTGFAAILLHKSPMTMAAVESIPITRRKSRITNCTPSKSFGSCMAIWRLTPKNRKPWNWIWAIFPRRAWSACTSLTRRTTADRASFFLYTGLVAYCTAKTKAITMVPMSIPWITPKEDWSDRPITRTKETQIRRNSTRLTILLDLISQSDMMSTPNRAIIPPT
mmetsp:Transcript_78615/g.179952  ORF Transcript_78615/g.179952 Transcript_78615/m.179952 type:complete len:215 (+) Transcript_78615:283-927(+)